MLISGNHSPAPAPSPMSCLFLVMGTNSLELHVLKNGTAKEVSVCI